MRIARNNLRSRWERWAETIRLCCLFMATMNCINAIFTLAGQLPTPDLVQSPQYRDLSFRTHAIYLAGLLILIAATAKWPYRGGWWLTTAVACLRISDNLHPGISVINIGMWLTVATIGTFAFVTTWARRRGRNESP